MTSKWSRCRGGEEREMLQKGGGQREVTGDNADARLPRRCVECFQVSRAEAGGAENHRHLVCNSLGEVRLRGLIDGVVDQDVDTTLEGVFHIRDDGDARCRLADRLARIPASGTSGNGSGQVQIRLRHDGRQQCPADTAGDA